MISEPKRAGLKCTKCGYELVVLEDKVFCQKCENKEGNFRQIKPR